MPWRRTSSLNSFYRRRHIHNRFAAAAATEILPNANAPPCLLLFSSRRIIRREEKDGAFPYGRAYAEQTGARAASLNNKTRFGLLRQVKSAEYRIRSVSIAATRLNKAFLIISLWLRGRQYRQTPPCLLCCLCRRQFLKKKTSPCVRVCVCVSAR